ncbi:tetratricopeptide repeat protein [Roseomonas populi]|uniref:Alpha/beta hydrolase n=1 Tax=Roseomonas populi TaxID=3121582 RepID=A0ABT1XBQ3_9PROT|nr:tetratricopeptide repeat protein [Roseomonas pecuniae]MCR0985555.1 hypothetical protein [Roseomonas pecuniae]
MTISQISSPTIIAEVEDIRAIFLPGKGDTLYVTFSEMSTRFSANRFWGDNLFLQHGLAALGIVANGPNWFPQNTMLRMLEAVSHKLHGGAHRRIVTYGFSMGAYAALKYGSRLGAEVCVAFCPQISINPAEVSSFDKRFSSHFDAVRHQGMRICAGDLARNNYIIFDPHLRQDASHARQISALGNTTSILSPLSGHHSIRMISGTGIALPFLQTFVGDEKRPALVARRILREGRRRWDGYWMMVADHLAKRGLTRASVSASRKAAEIAPHNTDCWLTLAASLLHAKEFEEAKALVARLESHQKYSNNRWFNIALAYRSASMPSDAAHAFHLELRRRPRDVKLLTHCLSSMLDANLHQNNAERFDALTKQLLENDLKEPNHWVAVSKLLRKAGRVQFSAQALEKAAVAIDLP